MMTQIKYRFSFTGAGAMIPEFIKITQLIDEGSEIDNLDYRTLGKEKLATSRRQLQELKLRLKNLSKRQIRILASGNIEEQKQMTHLALCKTYGIYRDFILDVFTEKIQVFDYHLTELDYNTFLTDRTINHPELEEIAQTTQGKVKQRLFKLLEQIGMLNSVSEGVIQTQMLNSRVERAVIDDDPNYLNYFLYDQNHIDELL